MTDPTDPMPCKKLIQKWKQGNEHWQFQSLEGYIILQGGRASKTQVASELQS